MTKEAITEFFTEFRENILEDGGDYLIVSAGEDYIRLKIKGKRNKARSRDNLYALLQIALNQRFPGHRIRFEMEPWKVKEEGSFLARVKDFLKGGPR